MGDREGPPQGFPQSPALGFVHEMGHAHDYMVRGRSAAWVGSEAGELHVIEGIETNIGQAYGEGIRDKHKGIDFRAACVLCNF